MPPSTAFGWLCVAHSVADIVFRAAQIRSAQALPKSAVRVSSDVAREDKGLTRPHNVGKPDTSVPPFNSHVTEKAHVPLRILVSQGSAVHEKPDLPENPKIIPVYDNNTPLLNVVNVTDSDVSIFVLLLDFTLPCHARTAVSTTHITLSSIDQPTEASPTSPTAGPQTADPVTVRHLQSSKVPASRIGRLFHYGGAFKLHKCCNVHPISEIVGLAASLGYGAASEIIRRSTVASNDDKQGSLIMSEANIKRLVSKLSQMRGAALKLGQFMSIQGLIIVIPTHGRLTHSHESDTHILPPEVDRIFRRVQDSAHYMPNWQMEVV